MNKFIICAAVHGNKSIAPVESLRQILLVAEYRFMKWAPRRRFSFWISATKVSRLHRSHFGSLSWLKYLPLGFAGSFLHVGLALSSKFVCLTIKILIWICRENTLFQLIIYALQEFGNRHLFPCKSLVTGRYSITLFNQAKVGAANYRHLPTKFESLMFRLFDEQFFPLLSKVYENPKEESLEILSEASSPGMLG